MDRRTLIAAGLAAPLVPAPLVPAAARDVPAVERFALWPGPAPGGDGLTVRDEAIPRGADAGPDDIAWPHVATPMLTVVAPARPNGAAILLIPGGGYTRVAIGRGGGPQARAFAASGYTVFELLYRLPHDGWAAGPDAPLQDAQRAIRVIRSRAARYGVDPARVAVIGFSAGGHLATRLCARAALQTYRPVDAADAQSPRPRVGGLFFPVVTMDGPAAHGPSKRELLGGRHDPQAYSAQSALPADMPPCFVACAGNDPSVSPENSIILYRALRANRTPAELMIFEDGGHNLPLTLADGSAHPWPGLFLAFARRHGLGV